MPLFRFSLKIIFMGRSAIASIEETTDALQRLQSLLWSGIRRERKLLELDRLSLFPDEESQTQAERWRRIIEIEIPRQAGYALLTLDCSRCEAGLEEAIRRRLSDSFTHREVGGNKTSCGLNAGQCRVVLPPEEVTCFRCNNKDKNKGLHKFSRLKEETRASRLYSEEQELHWNAIEDLYSIRCFIAHQGGRLRCDDIGNQNPTLENLEQRYQKYNLVQKGEDGRYILADLELCAYFRREVHELLLSVWSSSSFSSDKQVQTP